MNKNVWYLADGSFIDGNEADLFLTKTMNDFKELNFLIDRELLHLLKMNQITDDESLTDQVMNTGENFSLIRFQLHSLCKEIDRILSMDQY